MKFVFKTCYKAEYEKRRLTGDVVFLRDKQFN